MPKRHAKFFADASSIAIQIHGKTNPLKLCSDKIKVAFSNVIKEHDMHVEPHFWRIESQYTCDEAQKDSNGNPVAQIMFTVSTEYGDSNKQSIGIDLSYNHSSGRIFAEIVYFKPDSFPLKSDFNISSMISEGEMHEYDAGNMNYLVKTLVGCFVHKLYSLDQIKRLSKPSTGIIC